MKEEDKAPQAKTVEIEETVNDLKMALVDRKQTVADENLNSTQAWYELEMVQEELHKFKKKMTEDRIEMKKELYDRLSKEFKVIIKKEVKEQYEEKIRSPELKRPRTQSK